MDLEFAIEHVTYDIENLLDDFIDDTIYGLEDL